MPHYPLPIATSADRMTTNCYLFPLVFWPCTRVRYLLWINPSSERRSEILIVAMHEAPELRFMKRDEAVRRRAAHAIRRSPARHSRAEHTRRDNEWF